MPFGIKKELLEISESLRAFIPSGATNLIYANCKR